VLFRHIAALGCELERWPPYISNLVFELWELKPPTLQMRNNMAADSAAASDSSGSSSSSSSEGPGQFVVRVLYNKQPLKLQGATEGEQRALHVLIVLIVLHVLQMSCSCCCGTS
jgi:hypothetical protein